MVLFLGKSNIASIEKSLCASIMSKKKLLRTEFFNSETQRRNEDNLLIDELIQIFS